MADMKSKPSPAQRAGLRNMAEGKAVNAHVLGRSQAGGFTATIIVLRNRGWMDAHGRITPAGRAALER